MRGAPPATHLKVVTHVRWHSLVIVIAVFGEASCNIARGEGSGRRWLQLVRIDGCRVRLHKNIVTALPRFRPASQVASANRQRLSHRRLHHLQLSGCELRITYVCHCRHIRAELFQVKSAQSLQNGISSRGSEITLDPHNTSFEPPCVPPEPHSRAT